MVERPTAKERAWRRANRLPDQLAEGGTVKTPALDKMLSVKDDSQKIGAFLDWLTSEYRFEDADGDEHAVQLAYYCRVNRSGDEVLVHAPVTIEKLLADYFGIDLARCEKERRALLTKLREHSEPTTSEGRRR